MDPIDAAFSKRLFQKYFGIWLAAILLAPPALGSTLPKTQINFAGYTFDIKTTKSSGPGPNRYDGDGIKLDPANSLILTTRRDTDGHCTSSEVTLDKALGYGRYRWAFEGSFEKFQPNTVLGIFLYDSDDEHEYDVAEISMWGNSKVTLQTAAHTFQKTYTSSQVELQNSSPITCEADFLAGELHSKCEQIQTNGTKRLLLDNVFKVEDRPHRKQAKMHMNLWTRHDDCQNKNKAAKVLMTSFSFEPTKP